jgi:hypothetical protein
VALAEGVSTGDKRDGLFVAHRYASERNSDIARRSGRRPSKPQVGKFMISSAQLPVRTIRSAHKRPAPYLRLIGHGNRL